MTAVDCVLLGSALGQAPSVSELTWFALQGLFVVLLSLGLLCVACTGVGFLLRSITSRPKNKAAAPKTQQSDALELVAVISAAVTEIISEPHRIIQIRGLTAEEMERAMEGRVQHHISHTIQRRGHYPQN